MLFWSIWSINRSPRPLRLLRLITALDPSRLERLKIATELRTREDFMIALDVHLKGPLSLKRVNPPCYQWNRIIRDHRGSGKADETQTQKTCDL